MKIYLVGGAVRDELLGLPVRERDWVVVGANADTLLGQGYTAIGKHFPVFLHPETHEEYALARTERKSGSGHQGFVVHADPSVTLEQDLQRRDLTINAIAQRSDGALIDPCGGLKDLKQRKLRHIGPAFSEDPLRILRVARFAAKLAHLGFRIADETLQLMKAMSQGGELATLSPERIWTETEKALCEASPQDFLRSLYHCEALAALAPELNQQLHRQELFDRVETNIGKRIFAALEYAAKHDHSAESRFGIALHAVDTAEKPRNLALKSLPGKDTKNPSINAICARMKAPNRFREMAELANRYFNFVLTADSAKPDAILDLFERCDAWRRAERFEQFLQCCEALASTGDPQQPSAALPFLRTAFKRAQSVSAEEFVAAGIEGAAIGESLRNARKTVIASVKQQF